mmetsp:Transcript_31567/g.102879  ORF Transcript_31567/g.102879 Transcript_31567/m.102879 type:complete len:226 (+) Transcript_31567:1688-2365(+)
MTLSRRVMRSAARTRGEVEVCAIEIDVHLLGTKGKLRFKLLGAHARSALLLLQKLVRALLLNLLELPSLDRSSLHLRRGPNVILGRFDFALQVNLLLLVEARQLLQLNQLLSAHSFDGFRVFQLMIALRKRRLRLEVLNLTELLRLFLLLLLELLRLNLVDATTALLLLELLRANVQILPHEKVARSSLVTLRQFLPLLFFTIIQQPRFELKRFALLREQLLQRG